MPSYKYVIEFSEQDITVLLDIVTKGASSAHKILRANILLASDKRSDKYMTVAEIAKAYHTTHTTVQTEGLLIAKRDLKLRLTDHSTQESLRNDLRFITLQNMAVGSTLPR